MPCLNEKRTLGACIEQAKSFLQREQISGEIIIADNGSTDGSVELAKSYDVRVVHVPVRGYGAALAAGIEAARGEYIIMGDSDQSYDFSALLPFVQKLRQGYDLVVGNRFQGGIASGAMPFLHRYFGNPFLTAVGRLFFSCRDARDFYCGLRGFGKSAVQRLQLQSLGMEFALEMIIKATMHDLRVTEVPTTLSPDQRGRAPHLRRYRDGWRSLRFYLLMSPRWFFGIPGLVLLGIGAVGFVALLRGPIHVAAVTFDYHSLLYAMAAILLGYQSLLLFVFAKFMAIETGLHPPGTRFWFLQKRAALEGCIATGIALVVIGVALGLVAAYQWQLAKFGNLTPSFTIRIVACSVLFLLLGGQTLLGGFYFGLANLASERRERISGSSVELK
jgi:glycosyltransferase involved in cell wall biosynthesis